MIRFANESDTKAVRELWDIAFGEDLAFNDYYFKNIYNAENTLTMTENNKLLSMVQMLPYTIKGIGNATYIYGAATNPSYRGKGYMGQLLKKSFEIDIKNNVKASILIPADESLFDYYSHFGYKTGFYIGESIFKNTNEYEGELKEANNINDIVTLYNGDVERSLEYFNIQINMFNSLGGRVYMLYEGNEPKAYGFYWIKSNEVQEAMAVDEKYIQLLANHIMKEHNINELKITTMGNKAFGMIKYHSDNNNYNMYMNLMYN